jgi:hypothetical protein
VLAGLLLVMFTSATAALFRGRRMANRDMLEESDNLPFVAFSSKWEAGKSDLADRPTCVGFETFGDFGCKYLLHTKEGYYFFRPVPASRAGKTDKLDLYMIPDSDVTGIHIQRGVKLSGIRP